MACTSLPKKLRDKLQEAIDAAGAEADTVILGYGLCSMAVVSLKANGCTLVIPRVDDCIAIFLGSRAAYQKQFGQEPGTYYLTTPMHKSVPSSFSPRRPELNLRAERAKPFGLNLTPVRLDLAPQGLGPFSAGTLSPRPEDETRNELTASCTNQGLDRG